MPNGELCNIELTPNDIHEYMMETNTHIYEGKPRVNKTHDNHHEAEMPPPFTTRFPDVAALPLASQPSTLCGVYVAHGYVPQPFPPNPTPLVHRTKEKKLEFCHGKRKA